MKQTNLVKTNTANYQELAARKHALIAKLGELFAGIGTVASVSGLVTATNEGEFAGNFHVDCMLVLNDGQTYYFTFGYSQAKEVGHMFFIRILDAWFDGKRLVAKDRWLHTALLQTMSIQGELNRKGCFSVNLSQVEMLMAA
jgi:hypothetical protein